MGLTSPTLCLWSLWPHTHVGCYVLLGWRILLRSRHYRRHLQGKDLHLTRCRNLVQWALMRLRRWWCPLPCQHEQTCWLHQCTGLHSPAAGATRAAATTLPDVAVETAIVSPDLH